MAGRRSLFPLVLGALAACATPSTSRPTQADPALVSTAEQAASPGFAQLDPTAVITRIGLASCGDQTKPQPIWAPVAARKPDVFVMLGDNVYADAGSVGELETAYRDLGNVPGLAALRETVPVLAVWDDHDYGVNDAGREYTLKDESKTVMLDFFGEPADSPRRARRGNYGVQFAGPEGQRVQFLLLDTRYFRGALVPDATPGRKYKPNPEPEPMLGDEQWTWLEEQLAEPADVRILASSIQLIPDEHGYESWALFPSERKRLFDLLATTNGVVVISGDRHRGEISRTTEFTPYPLLELTASSINRPAEGTEPNRNRVGALYGGTNFGTIEIDWQTRVIRLSLVDGDGTEVASHEQALADMQSPG